MEELLRFECNELPFSFSVEERHSPGKKLFDTKGSRLIFKVAIQFFCSLASVTQVCLKQCTSSPSISKVVQEIKRVSQDDLGASHLRCVKDASTLSWSVRM